VDGRRLIIRDSKGGRGLRTNIRMLHNYGASSSRDPTPISQLVRY
jgi:hypothetical protein